MTEQRSCDARAGLEEDDDLQATLIKPWGSVALTLDWALY
jgi:hypothetical protein